MQHLIIYAIPNQKMPREGGTPIHTVFLPFGSCSWEGLKYVSADFLPVNLLLRSGSAAALNSSKQGVQKRVRSEDQNHWYRDNDSIRPSSEEER